MKKSAIFFLVTYLLLCFSVNAQTLQPADSILLKNTPTFTSIEEALKKPEEVIKLDLRRQKLKSIPPEVFTLTNLKYLELSKNKITEIPAEINKLTQLEYLNISDNKLISLHSEIGKLTKLKYLNIGENDIYSLPPEIGNLQNLILLDAWNNNLNLFPEELKNLKSLKQFDLRYITVLDKEKKRLKELLPNTKIFFTNSCSCQN
jgi:Leucine-rich repeat (LRR) protein